MKLHTLLFECFRSKNVSAAFRCWDCSRQTTFKESKKAKATMNCRHPFLSERSCRRCMYRYARATRTLRAAAALLALHADELADPCIKLPEALSFLSP